MEFYADASSLLITFYQILLIIFNCINTFYAELSISKKIFFFKELDENNLNFQIQSKRINKLLSQTNKESLQYPNFQKRKINNNKRTINDFSNNSNNAEKNSRKNSSRKSGSIIEILSINKYDLRSSSNEQSIDKLKRTQKLQTDNISYQKNVENIYNQKSTTKFNNSKIEDIQPIDDNKKRIKYDFNICEIIFASFFKCCLSKNLEFKNNINSKAVNFLNYNLDIVTYIRNQILFNIINETVLDDQIKSIINFLCRPVLSINHDIKNNFSDFYEMYEEKHFNKFSEELLELVQKPKKSIREKKLILLSNNHLKDYFNNS